MQQQQSQQPQQSTKQTENSFETISTSTARQLLQCFNLDQQYPQPPPTSSSKTSPSTTPTSSRSPSIYQQQQQQQSSTITTPPGHLTSIDGKNNQSSQSSTKKHNENKNVTNFCRILNPILEQQQNLLRPMQPNQAELPIKPLYYQQTNEQQQQQQQDEQMMIMITEQQQSNRQSEGFQDDKIRNETNHHQHRQHFTVRTSTTTSTLDTIFGQKFDNFDANSKALLGQISHFQGFFAHQQQQQQQQAFHYHHNNNHSQQQQHQDHHHQQQSSSSKTSATNHQQQQQQYHKKISKPMIEKRRRDRINRSLNILKQLIIDSKRYPISNYNKRFEKADILEITVKYLESLVLEERRIYQQGFDDCKNLFTKLINEYFMFQANNDKDGYHYSSFMIIIEKLMKQLDLDGEKLLQEKQGKIMSVNLSTLHAELNEIKNRMATSGGGGGGGDSDGHYSADEQQPSTTLF
ncbi:hypothetical protein DERP_009935 [Dermatophagoides pteronyssinus]|uniref:BHLH domain-containing protein n=1 Tax=Dermatophagoides pteronyssinus TaxID=6956 RepID=A0ABQ8J1Z0_DERPT|nr:hypothetical protein DERP_009935 [Dermatophagoides pteronyssinus]